MDGINSPSTTKTREASLPLDTTVYPESEKPEYPIILTDTINTVAIMAVLATPKTLFEWNVLYMNHTHARDIRRHRAEDADASDGTPPSKKSARENIGTASNIPSATTRFI